MRALLRWAADWRNGATLVASVLVALLAVTVVDARQGRQDALDALEAQSEQAIDSRVAASRRISMLLGEVSELQSGQATTAALIGGLTAQVDALRSQVQQLGAVPVAGVTTTTTAPPAPAPEPPARRRPPPPSTTTTTAPPSPPPSTTTTTSPGASSVCERLPRTPICRRPPR